MQHTCLDAKHVLPFAVGCANTGQDNVAHGRSELSSKPQARYLSLNFDKQCPTVQGSTAWWCLLCLCDKSLAEGGCVQKREVWRTGLKKHAAFIIPVITDFC